MTHPSFYLIANYETKLWKKGDDLRDKGLKIHDNVEVIDNIQYGKYKKDNLLSIMRPKNFTKETPLIINIHGGGFFYGDKDIYRFYASDLAQRGFVVITFNYRLAPRHSFPAALIDTNNVVKWIFENAEKYQFNTNKINFVGDSAGGNLSMMYTTLLTNPDYAKLFKLDLPKFVPNTVCLNSSVHNLLKFERWDQFMLIVCYSGTFIKNRINRKKFDTQRFITKDFPPVFMTSAPNDFMLYQQEPQYKHFLEKGVKVIYKIYGEKSDSEARHVFHLNQRLDIAKQANDDEAEFIRSYN